MSYPTYPPEAPSAAFVSSSPHKMLSRRWLRQVVRLVAGVAVLSAFLILADFYLNFLPVAVQTRLPHHIPSPVVLDIEVRSCYRASSCGAGTDGWYKHSKNLFLGQNWFEKAYLYTKRVQESELTGQERVLLDLALPFENKNVMPQRILNDIKSNNPEVKLDSLDYDRNLELAAALGWSLQDQKHGIWVKHGRFKPGAAISQVKVLFGENAVYPVPGWRLLMGSLQGFKYPVPRLAIRRGIEPNPSHVDLKFNKESGNFKIVQLADLHMSTDDGRCDHPVGLGENEECIADKRTMEFIGSVLDKEHPDLVVFTGDQIMGDQAPDPETAMLKAIGPVISREIPWALVFGNHDDSGPMNNGELMELARTLPGCLAEPGNVTGVGNYALKATVNGNQALTMYFMDSHSHIKGQRKPEYDWIRADQLQLMRDIKQSFKENEAKYSHIPLSMAFFHIPTPDYRLEGEKVGQHREGVISPVRDEGTISTLKELGVSVLSVGHDHCNDYCLKSDSLWMCYGGSAGEGAYGGYPDENGVDMQRRIRVFDIHSRDSSIYSWKWVRDSEEKLDFQKLV